MRNLTRCGAALSAVALGFSLVACGGGDTTSEGVTTPSEPTLASYVALGDAFTAGMVSNALVESHQAFSFPAQIARQAGLTSFQQPLVSRPGIDVELALVRLFPPPVLVAPSADTPGEPINAGLSGPYDNLGVPGATVTDLLQTDGTVGGFHGLVLRNYGTALSQALQLRPGLVTLWIGNSDALSAVIQGRAIDSVTLTPASVFAERYAAVLQVLVDSGATVLAGNIPDVTTFPYATTIPPVVLDPATGEPVLRDGQPVPLIGPNGTPLPSSSQVTLAASALIEAGNGIPVSEGGLGTSLPDAVVLDQNEADIIRQHVGAYNRAIVTACGTAGVPVVDVASLFAEIAGPGRTVGGLTLTSEYLSGGVFSYDGIHLTDIGYALVANVWINAINGTGASLGPVELGTLLGSRAGAARPGPEGTLGAFTFTQAADQPLRDLYAGRSGS